jgi:peptidoglycan-N-acetylglucosamine deacetylase
MNSAWSRVPTARTSSVAAIADSGRCARYSRLVGGERTTRPRRRTDTRRPQAVRSSRRHDNTPASLVVRGLAAFLVVLAVSLAFVSRSLDRRSGPAEPVVEADATAHAPSAPDEPIPAAALAPTAPPRSVAPTLVPAPTAPPLKGLVALTFDAGADRGYAEDILDLLATAHVPSSFGITGEWARRNPDLVRRMAADGHLVINHTLDHRSFTGLSDERGGLPPARRRAELEEADTLIAPLIGHTTRPWYRLPYGDDDADVAKDVAQAGFTRKVGWTVDSGGWRGWPAAEVLNHCLQAAEAGAIYVLHVGKDSHDGLVVGPLISGLRERGFGFATVSGLS